MKVAGNYTLDASREHVWPLLGNAEALLKIIPGCQQLQQESPTEYRGHIQLKLPAIVGAYTTYVRLVECNEPEYCRFEGRVEGAPGSISGTASFWLSDAGRQTTIEYEGQGLISGPLAQLNDRFVTGLVKTLIRQGLVSLNKQLQAETEAAAVTGEPEGAKHDLSQRLRSLPEEGHMTKIIDLSVVIGEDTLSPPSVNAQLKLTSFHRGPGFWQASKVEMLLHTGSHVDFTRHVQENGETAADVSLERVFGQAVVVDLSFVEPNHEISVADLEAHAPAFGPGDIVLVRTDWTEKHWGDFPTYYMESPYCSPEAAQWLVDKGAKAIGFDCFSEYCARLPDFTSEDFIIHKVILENGAILMQQLTNFSKLPTGDRFSFFGPFIKIRGGEGSPARFFALID